MFITMMLEIVSRSCHVSVHQKELIKQIVLKSFKWVFYNY